MAAEKTRSLFVPYVTPWEIYTASIILPLVGCVFVLLRFYARSLLKNSTGVDDWLLLPAIILISGIGISLIIGVHKKAVAYPTPTHTGYLTLEEEMTYVDPTTKILAIIDYFCLIPIVLAFGLIKLSITFYYRRIFVIGRGSLFDWITKVAIAIVLLWTIGFFFAFIFPCGTHFFADWGSIQSLVTYCRPSEDLGKAFVISDLITDIMVLCIPLPVIWKLQMTIGKKLIVTGILATGAVSIIASIIKVIITFELKYTADDAISIDAALALSTTLYWYMIEGGLGVIAACLPTLRVLVHKSSLSSLIHSLRSILSICSVDTQGRKWYQRSPPNLKNSYTHIHASSSAASTSDPARQKGKYPTKILIRGNVDGHSEPPGPGIHVTRQFSQHVGMV